MSSASSLPDGGIVAALLIRSFRNAPKLIPSIAARLLQADELVAAADPRNAASPRIDRADSRELPESRSRQDCCVTVDEDNRAPARIAFVWPSGAPSRYSVRGHSAMVEYTGRTGSRLLRGWLNTRSDERSGGRRSPATRFVSALWPRRGMISKGSADWLCVRHEPNKAGMRPGQPDLRRFVVGRSQVHAHASVRSLPHKANSDASRSRFVDSTLPQHQSAFPGVPIVQAPLIDNHHLFLELLTFAQTCQRIDRLPTPAIWLRGLTQPTREVKPEFTRGR